MLAVPLTLIIAAGIHRNQTLLNVKNQPIDVGDIKYRWRCHRNHTEFILLLILFSEFLEQLSGISISILLTFILENVSIHEKQVIFQL